MALRLAGFHKLFANDAEGVGALLEIIGTLYSVAYAFATYVITDLDNPFEGTCNVSCAAFDDLARKYR